MQTFFLEPKVADHMKLDGVVTLVSRKGWRVTMRAGVLLCISW